MALSIKTEEADRLARELSRLTGESMTEAVTKSLEERLAREKKARPKRRSKKDVEEERKRLKDWIARTRKDFDFSKSVTKAEYDDISGDNDIMRAWRK